MYGTSLEHVIKKETSGKYESTLLAMLRGTRPDWGIVQASMQSDIDILWRATEVTHRKVANHSCLTSFSFQKRIGTDEDTVIQTLTARSTDHLWALNQAYVQRSKKRRTFRQCIDSETSGNLKIALNALMTGTLSRKATLITFLY